MGQPTDTTDVPPHMRDRCAALNTLFRTEHPRLTNKISRIVGTLDAEDVAQAAFMRMLEHSQPEEDVRCLRGYLYRVAHNLAIDHVRRRNLSNRIFHPTELSEHHETMDFAKLTPDALSFHDSRETLRRVSDRLEDLPAKCQQAFVLSKVEESTYSEIAIEMDLSVSMIEKYLSRALSHIRSTVPYDRQSCRTGPALGSRHEPASFQTERAA